MEFFSLILVVLIVIYLFLLWRQRSQAKEKGGSKKESPKSQELRLENLGPGGVVSLSGVGEKMESLDLIISTVNCYHEGDFTWSELEADRGSEKVFIEIEDDDDLEFTITLQTLEMEEIGLQRSDLEKMVANDEGEISYNGTTYYFEDFGKAVFHRGCQKDKLERFKYWDFEAEDEEHFLSIEEWTDGSIDVSLSETLKPHQITVYSLEGEG